MPTKLGWVLFRIVSLELHSSIVALVRRTCRGTSWCGRTRNAPRTKVEASKQKTMADDFDAYQVLGIETGVESTDADVRRAYRKRAIETHPDKNRHRKDAAEEFDRVKRAYELLMDKDARAAHDHLIRVKQQRTQRYEAMDAKRRKMRDDLEAKEKEEWRKKSAEELAREKLQVRRKESWNANACQRAYLNDPLTLPLVTTR